MSVFTQASRCFTAIAETGSVRKAASALNASPSAVNRQLKQLEWQVGAPLFDRLPGGMQLTAGGKLLLEELQIAEQSLDKAVAAIGALKGLRQGQLSLGVAECLNATFVPDVVRDIRESHPGVSFYLQHGRTDRLVDQLLGGGLDVIVSFNTPPYPGLQVIHEALWPIRAILNPDHPLAEFDGPLNLRDCLAYNVLLPSKHYGLYTKLETAAARNGMSLYASVVSDSIDTLKGLVRTGAGVSFLTPLDAAVELQAGELTARPIAGPEGLSETVAVCTNRHRSPTFDTAPLVDPIVTRLTGLHRDLCE